MPRTVRLTDEATEDLAAIRAWQTQAGSSAVARTRVLTILNAIRRLRHTPCLHVSGDHPGTRELTSAAHRIVYEIDPDTGDNATAGDVLVLRVFGPGQSRDRL